MSLQVYNKTDPPISVIVDNDTYLMGILNLIQAICVPVFLR